MQRNGHLGAEEAGIGHVLEQGVTGSHLLSVLVHGLAQIVDEIRVHIGGDDDEALDAEGVGIIVLTGVGAGGDGGLDGGSVAREDLVDLLLGHVEDLDLLGGSEVQLTADGQTREAEGRVEDAVADGVGAVAETEVLKAGVVLGDVHRCEGGEGGVLGRGGRGADGNALAEQVMDVGQAGALERHAAEHGGVDRADDTQVVQLADVGELAGAVVGVENDVGGGDRDVDLTGGDVLAVLEGTGGGLGIALHTLDVVRPDLGDRSAGGVHGAAGVGGAEGHNDVAAGGLIAVAGGVTVGGRLLLAAGDQSENHCQCEDQRQYFFHADIFLSKIYIPGLRRIRQKS